MYKLSIYDLLYKIMCKLPDNFCNKDVINGVYNYLIYLQRNKWTSQEILSVIDNNNTLLNNNGVLDLNILFNKKSSCSNLLENKFYFHKELKIIPEVTNVVVDYDTGMMRRNELEDFFLEMRYSYTIDDLYLYITSKDCMEKNLNKSKVIGGIKWLLTKYDIQEILYMIDCMNNHIQSTNKKKSFNILDIQAYYTDAIELMQLAYNNMKVNNGLQISIKRRTKPNTNITITM